MLNERNNDGRPEGGNQTEVGERPAYVGGQGWAPVPGEAESGNLVARERSQLLLLSQLTGSWPWQSR